MFLLESFGTLPHEVAELSDRELAMTFAMLDKIAKQRAKR